MAKQRRPVVVAELGRPETAAETAARKARDSRLYRERKTVNNLVFSLLVSLGAMALIFLMVPRGTGDVEERTVDVAALAEESSAAVGVPLVAPDVPADWKPRQAALRTDGAVSYWIINYTTADQAYAAVVQAFTSDGEPVDDSWIAEQMERQSATGVEILDGSQWTVYDHPERHPDSANMIFGLELRSEASVLLVYGTDRPDVIRELAVATQQAYGGDER